MDEIDLLREEIKKLEMGKPLSGRVLVLLLVINANVGAGMYNTDDKIAVANVMQSLLSRVFDEVDSDVEPKQ